VVIGVGEEFVDVVDVAELVVSEDVAELSEPVFCAVLVLALAGISA
jgi:hypothetical protein